MKKSLFTEVFANIRHTWVSFVSIFMFIFLGVGIFMGLDWSGLDLLSTAESHFRAGEMSDFDIMFPYGIDEDDIAELRGLDFVSEVEGVYSAYRQTEIEGKLCEAHIISITESIDTFSEIYGTLPEKADEICLDRNIAKSTGLGIGDVVTFEANADDTLKYDTFEITAIVENPRYMNKSTASYGTSLADSVQADSVFYVRADAFEEGSTYGYALITCEGLEGLYSFSDEYRELSAEYSGQLSETANAIAQRTYEEVLDAFNEATSELENGIADGDEEVENAEKQLEDGRKELEKAEIEIDSKEEQAAEAKEALEKAEQEIAEWRTELDSGWERIWAAWDEFTPQADLFEETLELYNKTLEDLRKLLASVREIDDVSKETIKEIVDEARELIEDIREVRDFAESRGYSWDSLPEDITSAIDEFKELGLERINKVRDGEAKVSTLLDFPDDIESVLQPLIDIARDELGSIRAEINSAEWQLECGEEQLCASEAAYETGKTEYEDGLKAIAEARQELENGRSELETLEEELSDGKKELDGLRETYSELIAKSDSIKDYGAIMSEHTSNAAYIYVKMLSDILRKIKYSMGGLFLIISFLICYSAITRMINLQRRLIGTKKAFGFGTGEIAAGYLMYTGIASLAGAAAGLLMARFVVEPALTQNICVTFSFKCAGRYFGLGGALVITAAQLIIILAVSYLACRRLLREAPVSLMAGRKISASRTRFYEKTKIWDKASALTKTIISNLIADSPRVIATLVGVTGCCILMVSSLTLRENVLNSFEKQHSEYVLYDQILYYDNTVPGAAEKIRKILEDNGIAYSQAYRTVAYIGNSQMPDSFVHLIVCDDSISAVFRPESVDKSNPMEYEGLWLTESLQKEYGLTAGENVEIKSLDGAVSSAAVSGYYHHYCYRIIALIDRDTYESIYGYYPENNVFFIDTGERLGSSCFAAFEDELKEVDGYMHAFDSYENDESDVRVFKLIANVLVGLYAGVSVLMAIFVLLNLLMIFVDEKKTELIVLMINGYSQKAARRYISGDTVLLGVIGIILGIILGFAAGDYSTGAFESEYLYALHRINWTSAAIGALVTALLDFIMTMIAMRRIRHFKLSDINKM